MKTTTSKRALKTRRKKSLPPTPFKAMPREPHTHALTVVRKQRGNHIRMGCYYCPYIDPWRKRFVSSITRMNRIKEFMKPAQKAFRELGDTLAKVVPHDVRTDADGVKLVRTMPGRLSGVLDDVSGGKLSPMSFGWQVDADGRTPDEKPDPFTRESVARMYDVPLKLLGKDEPEEKPVFDGEHPHADIPEPLIEVEEPEHTYDNLMKMRRDKLIELAIECNAGVPHITKANKDTLANAILVVTSRN